HRALGGDAPPSSQTRDSAPEPALEPPHPPPRVRNAALNGGLAEQKRAILTLVQHRGNAVRTTPQRHRHCPPLLPHGNGGVRRANVDAHAVGAIYPRHRRLSSLDRKRYGVGPTPRLLHPHPLCLPRPPA